MGGSQSSYSKTEVSTAINNNIVNITENINKLVNELTIETLNEFSSNLKVDQVATCNPSNIAKINCSNTSNTSIKINQNMTGSCLQNMMADIVQDTDVQKTFTGDIFNAFASGAENQNNIVSKMDAQNYLEDLKKKEDVTAVVDSLANTIGDTMKALTGTDDHTETIKTITNSINTHFENKTYNKNDMKNVIKQLTANKLDLQALNNCKLDNSPLNYAEVNCNNLDNVLIDINQNIEVKDLQTCVNTLLTQNKVKDEVSILFDTSAESTSKSGNSADSDLVAKSKMVISDISTGFATIAEKFGMGLIMPIIILIVLIVGIPLLLKMVNGDKGGDSE